MLTKLPATSLAYCAALLGTGMAVHGTLDAVVPCMCSRTGSRMLLTILAGRVCEETDSASQLRIPAVNPWQFGQRQRVTSHAC